MTSLFFILIFGAVVFETVADVLLKYWAISARSSFLVEGFVLYILATFVWAISLRYGYLSKAITVFTILNLIVIVLAGVFLFKEDLTLLNKIGIVLGLVSVILLQM